MKAARRFAIAAIGVSVAVYALALPLPAIYTGKSYLMGVATLAFGWMQVLDLSCLAWLANPLYALAIRCSWRRESLAAVVLLALACFIGIDTFRLGSYHDGTQSEPVVVQSVGIAFYVWQVSFVLLAIANTVALLRHSKSAPDIQG